MTNANTAQMSWMNARLPNCRVAFRMAVSPPVSAIIATAGPNNTKCRLWLPQSKVV